MKFDRLPSSKDILEHPLHWRNYLRESKENSFVLFQYGSHILMSTDPYDYEGGKCVNDILKMMAVVRSIIHSCWPSTGNTIYKQKEDIRHVLRNCNSYPYSDTIRKVAEGLYAIVTKKQIKKNALEGAITQLSPVEEYLTPLRKELPVWGDIINKNTHVTEEILVKFLTTPEYLIQILLAPHSFIELNEPVSRIIDILSKPPTIPTIYYTMVWLYTKRCLGEDPEILVKFNEMYRKIINGESYDLENVLTVFCRL